MFRPVVKPEDFAKLICSLMSQEMLKQQENVVFGRTVTFRDRFVRYCYVKCRYPKYSLVNSREKILKVLETNILDESGRIRINAFDELLIDCYSFFD